MTDNATERLTVLLPPSVAAEVRRRGPDSFAARNAITRYLALVAGTLTVKEAQDLDNTDRFDVRSRAGLE